MSKTLGLYPNVIVLTDNEKLCFSLRYSNRHLLLRITPEHYSIQGNTITFHSNSGISDKEIAKIISSRFAYRMLNKPRINPRSDMHSLSIGDNSHNNILPDLFVLTFILDKIPALPEYHYPYLIDNNYSFSDDVLQADSVKELLRTFRHIKRVRLLSNGILNSSIPFLPELKECEIETIVNQDYYLAHFVELTSYPRRLKLIVYLDDISHFNGKESSMHFERVNISFFCPINNLTDLTNLENTPVPVFPFPSRYASKKVIHSLLDYSVEELLSNKSDEQLLLNNGINPYFYGNVVVNNAGDILSYPFSSFSGLRNQGKGSLLNQLKNNYYWTVKRSEFFEKCRKCAFLWLCPPLTNYEINLKTTFCKEK